MTLTKACVAECIGVFALCLVGGGSIMASSLVGDSSSGLLGIALAHGIILSIAVSAAMNVSGGHINPAVTIAMLITGRCNIGRAGAYIIAQVLGGVLAGYVLGAVMFKNVSNADGIEVISQTTNGTPTFSVERLTDVQMPPRKADADEPTSSSAPAAAKSVKPAPRVSSDDRTASAAQRAAAIEGIITFLLVFAVFGTAVDPRAPKIGGWGVGLTVTANILMAGPLTGACMNPARAIGTGFLAGDAYWQTGWLVYIVGPIAGAAFAAIVYQFLILENEPKKA